MKSIVNNQSKISKMKKFLAIAVIACAMGACNNSGDSTKTDTDSSIHSIDSSAEAKKDVIDSSAEAKKDKVDSVAGAKKDSVKKKTN